VISGDFEPSEAKKWVQKYFDEIKKGDDISPLKPQPVTLSETKSFYHEDNFARLPELTMTWPTVPQYKKDGYALDVLSEYLSEGKKAPFNKVLIDDKKVTSNVSMYNFGSELAGEFAVSVRAFPGTDLDIVSEAIKESFAKFEAEGISEKDLERIKAGQETGFYNSLSSVLGKGFQLAQYNIFANDPGFISEDINSILSVTTEDVMRVYTTYIKNKNHIATSFVPKGEITLALEGATKAEVVEEEIVAGAEENFDASITAEYEKTPSTFDRSTEPAYGDAPEITVPEIYEETLNNGLKVYGIENNEVPLVQFTISIKGGQLVENPQHLGAANFMANMLSKGTATKTTEELEEAIQQLGANINVFASKDETVIRANTLAKNYDKTVALIQEMILEPRWDSTEFELVKGSIKSDLQQQQANPNAVANLAYNELLYGTESMQAKNVLGTTASVEAMTIEDVKAYYNKNISPSVAVMNVVGALPKGKIMNSLNGLSANWEAKEVTLPETPVAKAPAQSNVYFYDVPNAKQSVLRIGYPALKVSDKDYYPATVMNYKLGGGGFASKLTQELREGKGYTYGIYSEFEGDDRTGNFLVGSGVRSNVTLESTQAIKEIMGNYGKDFTEEDLETTKSFLLKSNARAFETFGAKLGLLENISKNGLSKDYIKKREEIVKNMTAEEIKVLSEKYLDPNKMVWLVVGDKATQFNRMKELGYGNPILLNEPKKVKD
jgi:zinc protease